MCDCECRMLVGSERVRISMCVQGMRVSVHVGARVRACENVCNVTG